MNVLIIEDNENDAYLAMQNFIEIGYQVKWAKVKNYNDFIKALEDVKTKQYNIIVCDMSLPGMPDRMSGLDMLQGIISTEQIQATIVPWSGFVNASELSKLDNRGLKFVRKEEILSKKDFDQTIEEKIPKYQTTQNTKRDIQDVKIEQRGATKEIEQIRRDFDRINTELNELKKMFFGGAGVEGVDTQLSGLFRDITVFKESFSTNILLIQKNTEASHSQLTHAEDRIFRELKSQRDQFTAEINLLRTSLESLATQNHNLINQEQRNYDLLKEEIKEENKNIKSSIAEVSNVAKKNAEILGILTLMSPIFAWIKEKKILTAQVILRILILPAAGTISGIVVHYILNKK